jgi:hypothetical protein
MTVKEITAHCLDSKNSLYQFFKEKGFEEEEIKVAIAYHLEVFFCNMIHVLYIDRDIVDLKDNQNRRNS